MIHLGSGVLLLTLHLISRCGFTPWCHLMRGSAFPPSHVSCARARSAHLSPLRAREGPQPVPSVRVSPPSFPLRSLSGAGARGPAADFESEGQPSFSSLASLSDASAPIISRLWASFSYISKKGVAQRIFASSSSCELHTLVFLFSGSALSHICSQEIHYGFFFPLPCQI